MIYKSVISHRNSYLPMKIDYEIRPIQYSVQVNYLKCHVQEINISIVSCDMHIYTAFTYYALVLDDMHYLSSFVKFL